LSEPNNSGSGNNTAQYRPSPSYWPDDSGSGLFAIYKQLLTRPYEFMVTERMAPYDTLNALAATAALASVPFIWHRFGRGYAAIVVMGLPAKGSPPGL